MEKGELARELMLNILSVQTSFRQVIQRHLKQHQIDLTFEMLQILAYLWRKDGVNQQELAVKNFKDKASLTSLLKNLEAKDLVKRVEDRQDRRNKQVFLTESGRQYAHRVWPVMHEIYINAESEMNVEKAGEFINYLSELNDVFKKQ